MIAHVAAAILTIGVAVTQDDVLGILPLNNGDYVEFTRVVGPCVDGAKVTRYVYRSGKPAIEGCYKVHDAHGKVVAGYNDGDAAVIPLEHIKWRQGGKPATL